MEIYGHNGEGWKPLFDFEGWRIGMIHYDERFSKRVEDERHLLTDESFVLLKGNAVIYEENEEFVMEPFKVYNVKKGLWHHIVLSEDAEVLVVENSNTARENSERRLVK